MVLMCCQNTSPADAAAVIDKARTEIQPQLKKVHEAVGEDLSR